MAITSYKCAFRVPKSIQGLSLMYDDLRKQMILMAFIVWMDPTHSFDNNWVPLSDLPTGIMLSFLRQIGNVVFAVEREICRELRHGWVASPPQPREPHQVVWPHPGHLCYRELVYDPRPFVNPPTPFERFLITASADLQTLYEETKVRSNFHRRKLGLLVHIFFECEV